MSVTVSFNQLQKNLPKIIDRAVTDNDVCVVERNGENVAVIVSLREWKRHTVGEQIDALGTEYRLSADEQKRIAELLATDEITVSEQAELETLLNRADETMLRRAEVLDKL